MIAVHDARFRYTDRAAGVELHVGRFEVAPGQHVAVTGASGSGKTTLLHLIAGLHVPSSGSVQVLGNRFDEMPDAPRRLLRRTAIGMVFQEFELLSYLSVTENILLPLTLGAQRPTQAHVSRANALAERAGLGAYMGKKPDVLSQGERQRVGICRALLHEPSLVLCDEPTGNLDPATTARMTDLLCTEARRIRAGLVMVSHNHSELGRFGRTVDMSAFSTITGGAL